MSSDEVSGAALLVRIAEELAGCGPDLERLGALIGGLLASGASEALGTAQSADRLAQSLAALAVVVDRLASAAPADWTVRLDDVTAGVGLTDLVHRLSGRLPTEADPSGELELF